MLLIDKLTLLDVVLIINVASENNFTLDCDIKKRLSRAKYGGFINF
mgnify:FL=1